MIKKHPEQDRDGILGTLTRFGRGKVAPPAGNVGKPYVPPSRKNRKSFTTWQDETALSELRASRMRPARASRGWSRKR